MYPTNRVGIQSGSLVEIYAYILLLLMFGTKLYGMLSRHSLTKFGLRWFSWDLLWRCCWLGTGTHPHTHPTRSVWLILRETPLHSSKCQLGSLAARRAGQQNFDMQRTCRAAAASSTTLREKKITVPSNFTSISKFYCTGCHYVQLGTLASGRRAITSSTGRERKQEERGRVSFFFSVEFWLFRQKQLYLSQQQKQGMPQQLVLGRRERQKSLLTKFRWGRKKLGFSVTVLDVFCYKFTLRSSRSPQWIAQFGRS